MKTNPSNIKNEFSSIEISISDSIKNYMEFLEHTKNNTKKQFLI